MRTLNYYNRTVVALSTEDYQNAGLTRDEIKDVIKAERDPYSGHRLYPEPSGLNGNWEFGIVDCYDSEDVVRSIQYQLERLLGKKNV